MTEQPTPDQLAERARRLGADGGTEQDVADLIRDAEAGGAEHMAAVAGQVVNWPAGGGLPSVYDTATGRPALHESNVLIECRIRVEGRLFTAREAVDPYLFEMQFGADRPGEFDRYIDYFLRHHFGSMAVEPTLGPLIRSKVWIVKPGDRHDFQRCAESEHARPAMWQDPGVIEPPLAAKGPGPVPYCTEGVIVQPPGQRKVGGELRYFPGYTPLGTCPCRCHQRDGSAYRAEQLVRMHRHFPMSWDPGAGRFDEDQLPGCDDD